MGCPICKKDAVAKYRPFCSLRCADIDLGRWMTGKYSLDSHDEEDEHELLEQIDRSKQKPH